MIEEEKINDELLLYLQKLLESKEIRNQLSNTIRKLVRPNAVKEIVSLINKIIVNG